MKLAVQSYAPSEPTVTLSGDGPDAHTPVVDAVAAMRQRLSDYGRKTTGHPAWLLAGRMWLQHGAAARLALRDIDHAHASQADALLELAGLDARQLLLPGVAS